MNKKKTSLAGFGELANIENVTKTHIENKTENNENNNIENNSNTDIKDSTNNSINTDPKIDNDFKSVINSVIEVQKEKPKKIQISTYIDDDVHKLLEKFGKRHGKGAKSNLINELLRNALQ